MEESPKKFSLKSFLKSMLREIIVPVVLALIVIQYVIQAFQIPSGSMEDTLLTGDFLLGLKFTYGSPVPFSNQKFPGFTDPEAGDVVIFRYPGEPEYPDNNPERYTHLFNALMFGNFYWDHSPEAGQPHMVHFADGPKDYIKRCVAVGGDTVEVHKGKLFVNGIRQDTLPGRGKWTAAYRSNSIRDELEKTVVPSVGDTLDLNSMPLEKLWWAKSIIVQENPNDHVDFELSLWKDGELQKDFVFDDFRVEIENDLHQIISALDGFNGVRRQTRLTIGDTISGKFPFDYLSGIVAQGFIPRIDPHLKGGLTRPVAYWSEYYTFEAVPPMLKTLRLNVERMNAPVAEPVADSTADSTAVVAKTDSVVAGSAASDSSAKNSVYEIRSKISISGKPVDKYVIQRPLYFMMGDNRDNSGDSRYWGFASQRSIRAKAFIIYFSFESDDDFALVKPWTWWRIPMDIRWTRIGKVIPLID